MTLLDYLKERQERVGHFAGRIGEPVSTIQKIAYRQRQPSLPLAVKIERATDGLVTAADMLLGGDDHESGDTISPTVPSSGNVNQISASVLA
ncbi:MULTISPECIES: helix-turn-helix domain-containing protein [Sphingomonas]|uniref:helix-turn-helix domain-containing protein n=1 Tax=Sphingomonas TaxID=13687 RepID=UPI0025506347|nr:MULTISPECIES: helix-turn-helix transcriptional regulator [Sphingomonas]MDK8186700.1 hypothetical protein [Sphingomonas zeae]